MKKLFYLLLVSGLIWSCSTSKNEDNDTSGPELIWSEEFDYDGLPAADKWDYRVGGHGWGNNELQYYTKREENARVENGNLVITAIKEPYDSSSYTSGAVLTYGKQDFLYGRIEVRAKLPVGRGTWPAIWLLGTSIREETGWPECGEIDIMENVGYDSLIIHGNVHTKAYNHVMGTNKGNQIEVSAPWEEYHVYAVEWFEDRIDFFVDDQKYFSFENEGTGNDTWPFDKPHYLILNLAIGGNWGGQQGVDDSSFPHQYFIDYVRYYKLP